MINNNDNNTEAQYGWNHFQNDKTAAQTQNKQNIIVLQCYSEIINVIIIFIWFSFLL